MNNFTAHLNLKKIHKGNPWKLTLVYRSPCTVNILVLWLLWCSCINTAVVAETCSLPSADVVSEWWKIANALVSICLSGATRCKFPQGACLPNSAAFKVICHLYIPSISRKKKNCRLHELSCQMSLWTPLYFSPCPVNWRQQLTSELIVAAVWRLFFIFVTNYMSILW